MILDNDLILSAAQAITDDAYSTNVWDRGAAGATGKDLWLVFRVHTAFVSAGGATLQIEIRTAAALSGSDLTASVKLLLSRIFAVADLTVDTIIWKVKASRVLLSSRIRGRHRRSARWTASWWTRSRSGRKSVRARRGRGLGCPDARSSAPARLKNGERRRR